MCFECSQPRVCGVVTEERCLGLEHQITSVSLLCYQKTQSVALRILSSSAIILSEPLLLLPPSSLLPSFLPPSFRVCAGVLFLRGVAVMATTNTAWERGGPIESSDGWVTGGHTPGLCPHAMSRLFWEKKKKSNIFFYIYGMHFRVPQSLSCDGCSVCRQSSQSERYFHLQTSYRMHACIYLLNAYDHVSCACVVCVCVRARVCLCLTHTHKCQLDPICNPLSCRDPCSLHMELNVLKMPI